MNEEQESHEERQIVVFTIGEEEFGVNINEVLEIIRAGEVTRMPNTAPYVMGVINLRGSIIVVVDLAMKLGLQSKKADKNTRVIVIEIGENTVGMVVDSATEVLRLSNEQIQPPPGVITEKIDANYVDGVGILGERLLILLDLAKVLQSHEMGEIANLQRSATESAPAATSSTGGGQKETPQSERKEKPEAEGDAPAEGVAGEKEGGPNPGEEHPALKDVHQDFHFITHEGRPIKNVHELLSYVKDLDSPTFQEFVNEEKNDFYNWVKHAVKDEGLAEKIRHVTSKEDVSKEIMDRILHIKLKG